MTEPTTPLMQQYLGLKKQHPTALLLFRLGDFYELFYDDAIVASRILQITLTSRNKEKDQAVPMCGVPYHAAENYIAKLIRAGHKVAISEQMEVPGPREETGTARGDPGHHARNGDGGVLWSKPRRTIFWRLSPGKRSMGAAAGRVGARSGAAPLRPRIGSGFRRPLNR